MPKLKISIKPQSIIIAIAAAVTIATTYFVAIPQASRLSNLTTELTVKKEQSRLLNNRRDSLQTLTFKLPGYAADIERLALAYPQEEQTVEALIQAQAMIERSGMAVESLAPTKSEERGLQMTMVLKGSYESLISLLRELDDNLRPVIIDNITVQAAANEKEVGILTATLNTSFTYNNLRAKPLAGGAAALIEGPPSEIESASQLKN